MPQGGIAAGNPDFRVALVAAPPRNAAALQIPSCTDHAIARFTRDGSTIARKLACIPARGKQEDPYLAACCDG